MYTQAVFVITVTKIPICLMSSSNLSRFEGAFIFIPLRQLKVEITFRSSKYGSSFTKQHHDGSIANVVYIDSVWNGRRGRVDTQHSQLIAVLHFSDSLCFVVLCTSLSLWKTQHVPLEESFGPWNTFTVGLVSLRSS